MRRSMTFLAAAGIALFLAAPLSFGQELTGDDYIQFMKPLEGSWTTTLKMDGDPVPGKLRYELAPNKHCYLTQMEGGGLPFINGIEGYDPVAKRWTGMGFADDREHSSSTVEWADMKPGKVLGAGAAGKQTLRLGQADGTTTTIVQTMTCEKVERDKVILVYTKRTADGAPLPDMVFTLTRKP